MQKIRLLLIIDDASIGGGQMHVLLLAKYLQGDKFAVEIATELDGWLVEEAHKLDIVVHQISISNNLKWKYFQNIRQILRSQEFDIIHTHGGTAGFWGRLGSISLKQHPVVVHTYHGLHYLNISANNKIKAIKQQVKSEIFKLIDRVILSYTDRIICVCRSDYEKAISAGVAIPNQTSIVYNGIEIDFFINPVCRENVRRIFGLTPTEFIFGNIGRLHEQKGHKYLLEAFAKVTNPARLLIVGDGELRDELITLANKLEISDRVSFLGARSDVKEFLSAIDVFIMPSLWEGQPIALLEALALNKPCIASDVDGIPEIITDGVNGYLVQPRDIDKLARIMNLVVTDRVTIEQLSTHHGTAIDPKFSAQNMALEVAKIYLGEN